MLLTPAFVHCHLGCEARPCHQGLLFWMATRALMHKIKNLVAAYFPSRKNQNETTNTNSRSIELTRCVNNIKCCLSFVSSLSQCPFMPFPCTFNFTCHSWKSCINPPFCFSPMCSPCWCGKAAVGRLEVPAVGQPGSSHCRAGWAVPGWAAWGTWLCWSRQHFHMWECWKP